MTSVVVAGDVEISIMLMTLGCGAPGCTCARQEPARIAGCPTHPRTATSSTGPRPSASSRAGRRRGDRPGDDAFALAGAHPASSLPWVLLAEATLREGGEQAAVTAYAFARTGYHRGLDALRRAGWRGQGPIPADHVPNQGFLRALLALSRAASLIGEDGEAERCAQFLVDSGTSADEVGALAG